MACLGIYLVASALLAWAGLAKALHPSDTARALSELTSRSQTDGGPGERRELIRRVGLAWWVRLVRVLAAVEGMLGVVGLVYPHRAVAGLVAMSYLAFAVFILYARSQGGSLATCGCFGSPDTPPTVVHVVVNLVLAAGSISVAAVSPPGTIGAVLGRQKFDGWPLVTASLITAALAYAALVPLSRLSALRHVEIPTSLR